MLPQTQKSHPEGWLSTTCLGFRKLNHEGQMVQTMTDHSPNKVLRIHLRYDLLHHTPNNIQLMLPLLRNAHGVPCKRHKYHHPTAIYQVRKCNLGNPLLLLLLFPCLLLSISDKLTLRENPFREPNLNNEVCHGFYNPYVTRVCATLKGVCRGYSGWCFKSSTF